jgi:UDP-N-acetylmuramyl tripeptide synthase
VPLDVLVRLVTLTAAAGRRIGRLDREDEPGRLFLKIRPDGLALLAGRLRESVAVSATNGKTTTATLAAAMLARSGASPVHNDDGENMAGGVAKALMEASRSGGGARGAVGVFEIDEGWLPYVAPQLEPSAILLGNLFRDQLDRFGEIESLVDRWAGVVAQAPETTFVLNADDPLVADLGRHARKVVFFGLEGGDHALTDAEHVADVKHCRRCGAATSYSFRFLAHLGHYRCPDCGLERPTPHVAAEDIQLEGLHGTRLRLRTPAGIAAVRLRLPGLHNLWNATAAAALGYVLGVPLEHIVGSLEDARPVWGRGEEFRCGGRPVVLTLVKNPAGVNTVLRTLDVHTGELDLLWALNDRVFDGRDVSWIWDADIELIAPRVRALTCCGTRAAELALRLKYAGVSSSRIVVEPDVEVATQRAIARATGPVHALGNYTAMLALRDVLAATAHATTETAAGADPASGVGSR